MLTAVGIAIAAGTLGVFVGTTTAGVADDRPPSRADHAAREEIRQLHDDVAERDEMILALRQRIERTEAAPTPPRATQGGAGKSAKRGAQGVVTTTSGLPMFERRSVRIDPGKARAAADRLGVAPEELEIAQRVFENAENLSDPKERQAAFDALQALGERRTRAMVALVRAIDSKGIGSGGMRKALEAAHFDGQEHLLIDLLKDGTTPRATKEDVLRNIEPFDSPEVREYLLQRLAAETDRYFYATLILALGRLKETRVAPEVRRLLARDANWIPFHVYGITVLGKVGGPEAEAILLEHLRSGSLGNLGSGVNALAKLNPSAARSEAQAILARPEAAKLPAKVLETLRRQAR